MLHKVFQLCNFAHLVFKEATLNEMGRPRLGVTLFTLVNIQLFILVHGAYVAQWLEHSVTNTIVMGMNPEISHT